MSVLVLILQCETKSSDKNIENLQLLFSDSYFITQVYVPPVNPNKDYNVENYNMRNALFYASQGPFVNGLPTYAWKDIPCLIVKDSSSSILTALKIMSLIKETLLTTSDLYFLCKWQDMCSKCTNIKSIDNGVNLKWSINPTATQAILYSPKTRDFVANELMTTLLTMGQMLNNNIVNNGLLALVFFPNLIEFDVNLATSNSDYEKLNQCLNVSDVEEQPAVVNLLFFILIMAVVLIIAWAIIQLAPIPDK
jgi:hypothetical protein